MSSGMRIFGLMIAGWLAAAVAFGQEPTEITCPRFSVSGPAGIVAPGEPITWVVEIFGKVPDGLFMNWSVTNGAILDGQGSRTIKASTTLWSSGQGEQTAAVRVEGLPDGCPNTASETYSIAIDQIYPILIGEFSLPASKIDRKALLKAADELDKNPTDQMYIIDYLPPGAAKKVTSRRILLIKEFLSERPGRLTKTASRWRRRYPLTASR